MSQESVQARAIFIDAVENVSPERWREYLDEACGDDAALRDKVQRLLDAHGAIGSFMDKPAAAPVATVDQPITEKLGTQIGPYKLLQQLGEGGMGVVYMAEQKEPVKRRVALKIIKPGMDTRQVITRFEAERQALAMMDHPNIAKVLDAGATESGRPYFVMELVNGLPVTKYCDEQHLTPKERLELFVPICQAVQHAHQKGIIHRDLKPSNILVALYDGKPVPKIIDFGVAKATSQTLTEKTMLTQLGQVVGTLEYMSPEQAERNQLDIDTRSDIYSLGVVLYELLTGETPFDRERLRSAAFDEMLRIIREEEPSKPSTKVSSSQSLPSIAANRRIEPAKLGSIIRGELDWIVLKAMEKDRGRRYETASKFAEDVQHYLNDEAVVACPPSAGYRLRKFLRRNKAALLATMLVGCALLVAVAGIMGGVGWAVRDRAAQQAAAEREKTERQGRITTHVELLLSDVDRLAQEQRWDEALAVAKRAEVAIASDAVEAAVNEKVRSVLRELEFVARLSEIRMEIATVDGNSFTHAGAAENYRQAFRDFGVDLDSSAANAAVFQLKRSPRIILPVAEALDELVNHGRKSATSRGGTANLGSLVDIARGLDPDPVRNQLRATWGRKVTPELQAELQGIVESFDPRLQGPLTATRLADTLELAGRSDLEEQVLRKAQAEFPSDYWINMRFGLVLIAHNEPAEAAKFFCVARAIKPDSVSGRNSNFDCRVMSWHARPTLTAATLSSPSAAAEWSVPNDPAPSGISP